MTLKGKVAIVTGGNSGIGKAIVLALAGAGANIVIDYVANEAATEELERQVAALGDQAIGVQADVSKVSDLQMLVDQTVKEMGRLDIMVNNAGIETRTSVLDTTEAQYEKVMEINLKSAFFGTQLAAKQMIAQGGGGPGHQHHLGARGLAHARQRPLLPVQGRDAHADPPGRHRAGPAPHLCGGGRPRGGGHPHQYLDHGRPGQDEDPGRRHPPRPHGRARARSAAWWPSWPATGPAT